MWWSYHGLYVLAEPWLLTLYTLSGCRNAMEDAIGAEV